MIPNHTNRNVQTSGVSATGEFQISLAHSAHIMRILRSQLYSDKILAVLREYSANAWDANREVGKGDIPIQVTIPVVKDPTLYIRDFGPGISHEDMFAIYAQYGVSTKRGNDGQVGMLGIGSKSGFAYTDSFTITTWQDGTQRIYTALLNNDEKGTLNLLDESKSEEPNGTMIQIPVKPADIPDFVNKAEKLFFHFKPRPIINIALPPEPVPEVVMKNGSITRGDGTWMAVMGCIAYAIDLNQLRGLNAHRGGAGGFLNRLDGYLYFNIGEIEIAASREGLEYSDKTKAALIDKLIDLVDEFVKQTLDSIEAGDFSFWEKRCRAQVLNDLQLPVPTIMDSLTDHRIDIGEPKSFIITCGPKQAQIRYVSVSPHTRLIIRDEARKIDGYGLSGLDYVVRINKDVLPIPTLDAVRAELNEIIEKTKITGVQVVNISSMSWHERSKFTALPKKKTNKKHQVKTFVLKTGKHYGSTWSTYWDIEDRTPTSDDVFVLLRGFKVLDKPEDDAGDSKFYSTYRSDEELFEHLKVPMPRIYGYKSTEKDPADLSKILGKQYEKWRPEHLKGLLDSPGIKEIITLLDWMNVITRSSSRFYYRENSTIPPVILSKIFSKLGKDHPVCSFLRKALIAKRNIKRFDKKKVTAVRELLSKVNDIEERDESTEPSLAKNNIENTYPMFGLFNGIHDLLDDDSHTDHWIEYIQTVDKVKKGLSDNESTIAHSNGRSDHSGVEWEGSRSEEGSTELRQSEECNPISDENRGMGPDWRSPDSTRDSTGMVEQQVRPYRIIGDILRAAGT